MIDNIIFLLALTAIIIGLCYLASGITFVADEVRTWTTRRRWIKEDIREERQWQKFRSTIEECRNDFH